MDLGAVIHSYGGPVLFVWAWLQGEAAVIVGGSLAARGYWPWWAVWLFACVPATLRMQPAIARARTLVRENAVRVMLVMRFAYGIRLPLPILCGAVGITPLRFLRYNALTALVWALLFTWLGYVYGAAAGAALARVAHYEAWFLVGAVAFGLSVAVLSQRAGSRLT